MSSERAVSALKKFKELDRKSVKVPQPVNVDLHNTYMTANLRGRRFRQEGPSSPKVARTRTVTRRGPKVQTEHKVVVPIIIVQSPTPETSTATSAGGDDGPGKLGRRRKKRFKKRMKTAFDVNAGMDVIRRSSEKRGGKPGSRIPSFDRPVTVVEANVKDFQDVKGDAMAVVMDDDGTVFYDVDKQEEADRRRGKDRMVVKLAKDYEAARAPGGGGIKRGSRRRQMGGVVGKLAEGFEGLAVEKDRIAKTAEDAKLALKAEKEAEMAKLAAEEAKRLKEQHENKVEELTEKKEEILDQELEATMSNLALKKEDIVEEEFKENVRVVDADAEMKRKRAEEEAQRLAALQLKWYDPKNPVKERLIFKPRNVQEKRADMNRLVERIGADVARDKRRSRKK